MGKNRKKRQQLNKPLELRLIEKLREICTHHSIVRDVLGEHHADYNEVALFVFLKRIDSESIDKLIKGIEFNLPSAVLNSDAGTRYTVSLSLGWGEEHVEYLEF